MSEKINYIKDFRGAKGGPQQPPAPVQTPDNLRSKDSIEVVLGICAGPIKGLVDGAKSFLIGDTPLQNSNGEYNYKTFVLNFFPGNDIPDPVVPILGGQGNSQSVNINLASNSAVTRQTTTRGIDVIDIRLVWQALYKQNDSGVFNADALVRIEYKRSDSATWIKAYNEDIKLSGKTTSNYVKEFRLLVDKTSAADWDIRITNLSPVPDNNYINSVVWESIQETIQTPISYPGLACVQLSGEASDQFSSIPQWAGIYDLKIIKIPSNYNPETRVYTGPWDGTFQLACCNNPAWVLYDFVMDEENGIKSYYKEINLDKYDVYEAGKWCDELVPDGEGGFQPRYTFNAVIQEAVSGKELAEYIAGSFNSCFFDDLNGTAYLKIDKDDDAQHIFTKENVINGVFTYSYTDIVSRFNDFTVTFINPDLDWAEDRRRVFDQDLIDKNGRIPYDYVAVGCTNEHEAIRKTWLRLITSNTETCSVNFTTNRLGSLVKPFDIILVCDPDMGYGISGRIKSIDATRKEISLRNPVYLESGVIYNFQVTLDTGQQYSAQLVNTSVGYNSILYAQNALPENIPDKGVFTLEADGVIGLPRPFRVLSVQEEDGNPDLFTIQGININRNKWYDADNITNSGVIKYSALPNPYDPPGPTSCSFSERFVRLNNEFHIQVNPVFNRGAYKYYANDHSFDVWSRLSGTNDAYVKRELRFGDTLVNHPAGMHDFKVLGKSYLGKTTSLDSAPVYQFEVTNPKTPPTDIDWIRINKREVYWGYANPPEDFEGFEVRYQNEENRTTWDDANKAHQGTLTATSFYTQLIPPSARVIMVRPKDVFGVYSDNSAIIFRTAPSVLLTNEVERYSFKPAWVGTKVNCSVDSNYSNYHLYSEEAGDASYGKLGLTVTSNTALAPDGTTTADRLVEDTSGPNIQRRLSKVVTVPSGDTFSYSVYVKPSANRQGVTLYSYTNAGADGGIIDFDFSNFTATPLNLGTGIITAYSMRPADNGFFRIDITVKFASAITSLGCRLYYSNNAANGNAGYAGDGSSYIEIWGSQVTPERLRDYVKSVATAGSYTGTNDLGANDTGTNLYSGVPTAFMYDGANFYDTVYSEMTYQGQFTTTTTGDLMMDIEFEGSGYEVTYKPSSETVFLPIPERQSLLPGTYDIKVRIFGGSIRGKITKLDVVIDAEDILEDFSNIIITNAASGIRLPITRTYSTIKIVTVAIQGTGTTAVGYRVEDKNPTTGPLIKLVDANGSFTTGTFDATIKGFTG